MTDNNLFIAFAASTASPVSLRVMLGTFHSHLRAWRVILLCCSTYKCFMRYDTWKMTWKIARCGCIASSSSHSILYCAPFDFFSRLHSDAGTMKAFESDTLFCPSVCVWFIHKKKKSTQKREKYGGRVLTCISLRKMYILLCVLDDFIVFSKVISHCDGWIINRSHNDNASICHFGMGKWNHWARSH